jgi:transcriptional regulator with XRE-family HTH domain
MGFSKRLKELRENRGLSQEGLAKRLNIPRSSITHYERSDDRLPRQTRLNELADFFGVSVDYLIGRAETSELSKPEKVFVDEVSDPDEPLSLEELMVKYNLTVDGKKATKEEIAAAISFIRSLRGFER